MAILYYSKRCRHSENIIRAIESVPDVAEAVQSQYCVETSPFPRSIRQVPAIVDDDGKVYEGQDAFRWVQTRRESVPSPFWYENTGPSPSALFSYVDEDSGHGHRQDAFGSFDEGIESEAAAAAAAAAQGSGTSRRTGRTGRTGGGRSPDPLDALIEKRKLEVPQPIRRQ